MSNSFKTTKHKYKNILFMSQGEVEMYKLLENKNANVAFKYQPEPIEILPSFTASSNKKYKAMNYEADFWIPGIGNSKGILLEVKGKNNLVYTFRKGKKPAIKDNSELYWLKHKVIDYNLSNNGYTFLVVRHGAYKTPEYAGMFWDKDFERMKKFKTEGRKDLCAKVPRIMERIHMLLKQQQEDWDEAQQMKLNLDSKELNERTN